MIKLQQIFRRTKSQTRAEDTVLCLSFAAIIADITHQYFNYRHLNIDSKIAGNCSCHDPVSCLIICAIIGRVLESDAGRIHKKYRLQLCFRTPEVLITRI